MQNPGLRQPNQYERFSCCTRHDTTQRVGPQLVSTSTFGGVHLHQTRFSCVPVRSGRKKKGVQHCFSSFKITVSIRLH